MGLLRSKVTGIVFAAVLIGGVSGALAVFAATRPKRCSTSIRGGTDDLYGHRHHGHNGLRSTDFDIYIRERDAGRDGR